MTSSARAGQAQPEALRFSQLKKQNFWSFSPLLLAMEGPIRKITRAHQSLPRGALKTQIQNFSLTCFYWVTGFARNVKCSKKKLEVSLTEGEGAKFKKWHNFFLRAVGFQGCVPRHCALKRNAEFPYLVKKVCSFSYNYALKRNTVFPNYLLDVQRIGKMGTSFFTMLCQMEGASLVIAAVKENDNFLYPQKKVMSLLRCATQAEELATSPHSAKKIKRRPCSHLHPPPSTITHQSHKCLGKAFLNYRGVCHSARKWNASQLQTTLERISELISCDKTSVHFDVHAGSSEIWIQPPELKSLISQGYLHGLCFEFCWGLPLRSTPVPQTWKPNCSPD